MFKFIKKIYNQFTSIFKNKKIDNQTILELEKILITSDAGLRTTQKIIDSLKKKFLKGEIEEGEDLKLYLEKELIDLLNFPEINLENSIYLLVGVNGSGKTTFAGKLAALFNSKGEKTLLIAADTFRAAAKEQLEKIADKTGVSIETGSEKQDPASVVFTGCKKFKNEKFDKMIIDTAGRIQTKKNLMKELEKIKKVIKNFFPEKKIITLLTIDAMLGQNSFEQSKIFNDTIKVDGIVLTKIDGSGKGGIIFAIVQELGLPISFISFGESIKSLKKFDKKIYVSNFLGEKREIK